MHTTQNNNALLSWMTGCKIVFKRSTIANEIIVIIAVSIFKFCVISIGSRW